MLEHVKYESSILDRNAEVSIYNHARRLQPSWDTQQNKNMFTDSSAQAYKSILDGYLQNPRQMLNQFQVNHGAYLDSDLPSYQEYMTQTMSELEPYYQLKVDYSEYQSGMAIPYMAFHKAEPGAVSNLLTVGTHKFVSMAVSGQATVISPNTNSFENLGVVSTTSGYYHVRSTAYGIKRRIMLHEGLLTGSIRSRDAMMESMRHELATRREIVNQVSRSRIFHFMYGAPFHNGSYGIMNNPAASEYAFAQVSINNTTDIAEMSSNDIYSNIYAMLKFQVNRRRKTIAGTQQYLMIVPSDTYNDIQGALLKFPDILVSSTDLTRSVWDLLREKLDVTIVPDILLMNRDINGNETAYDSSREGWGLLVEMSENSFRGISHVAPVVYAETPMLYTNYGTTTDTICYTIASDVAIADPTLLLKFRCY